jgi:hypothetical protein
MAFARYIGGRSPFLLRLGEALCTFRAILTNERPSFGTMGKTAFI